MNLSSDKIHQIIRDIINRNPSRNDINYLIYFAQKVTAERIKQLIKYGRISRNIISSSIELVAFDSIAELFRRDDEGNLTEFIHHFSVEIDSDKLSSDEILREVRILIFQRLNHYIFNLYSESDPVLSKIIKHIKYKVRVSDKIKSAERFGEIILYTGNDEERKFHLPPMSLDVLINYIGSCNIRFSDDKDYLDKMLEALKEQNEYSAQISLINAALCVKFLITQKQISLSVFSDTYKENLQGELIEFIERAIDETKFKLRSKFVEKNKLTAETYDNYFFAIKDMILETMTGTGSDGFPAYEYLMKYIPDLDSKLFREIHREKFEYLLKLSRNILKDKLREIL